jgi:hypothetical protein
VIWRETFGFSLVVATRLLQKLESFDLSILRRFHLTKITPGEVKTRRFLHAILNRNINLAKAPVEKIHC